MICKYFSKTFKNGFKCKLHKNNISYQDDCKNCSDFILVANKGIKKVSKKKIKVTNETYQKVFERDNGKCQLCGTSKELQLHHVLRERKRTDK